MEQKFTLDFSDWKVQGENNGKRDMLKNILRNYLNSKENPYKLPDG